MVKNQIKEERNESMSTFSLADLAKANKLQQGLPEQDERMKFKQQTVMGRDGVYLSYLTDFFDVVYRIDKFNKRTQEALGNIGVPEVSERFQTKELIPSENIHKMVAWYRYVTFEYGTEATMQVFYDNTGGEVQLTDEMAKKYEGSVLRDGNFVYIIPEQNVTGGFVSFHGEHFPKEMNGELYEWALANFEPVLNIHSHNSMSAFWSGTDDKNELPLYNRLCLVIGKLNTDHPTFRFSWNFEGKRHNKEVEIDTLIKPLEIKTTTTITGMGINYESVEEKGFNDSLGYLDYDKVDFDKRWDERIRARGRFGLNRGKMTKITELSKKETELTAEESRRIQLQEDVTDLNKTTFGQDKFYSDKVNDSKVDKVLEELELADIEVEEDTEEEIEDWKKDLVDFKNKNLKPKKEESVTDGDETKEEMRNATSFRRHNTTNSRKNIGAFEKFQQDKIRKQREQKKKDSKGSFWKDIGFD